MGAWFSKIDNRKEQWVSNGEVDAAHSYLLHRNINTIPRTIVSITDNWMLQDDGNRVYDASGGAAVSSLGHAYRERIATAMFNQLKVVDYVPSNYTTKIAEELAAALIETTHGDFAKVAFYSTGSCAMEAAIKMAAQYDVEKPKRNSEKDQEECEEHQEEMEPTWISRKQSYHGNTLGALSVSDHKERRKPFEHVLKHNVRFISACNSYRDFLPDESNETYIARKAQELRDTFQEVSPGRVIGVFFEPISGASIGCAPPPRGYLKRMKEVCHEHGALVVYDEIMCGMGRTGTWHAYQHDEPGSEPDILVLGKGLAAGSQPVSAMLINHKIADVLSKGTESFVHGHTHQNHPLGCAVVLEVIKIIREYNLLDNVSRMGDLLDQLLHDELDHLPHVGNVRGCRFFQGIEFIMNKSTKAPFARSLNVANRIHKKALGPDYQMYVYPGQGTADGFNGDHIIIAPPFNATEADIRLVVSRIKKVIVDFYDELNSTDEDWTHL